MVRYVLPMFGSKNNWPRGGWIHIVIYHLEKKCPVYDASLKYKEKQTPLLVFNWKDTASGSIS